MAGPMRLVLHAVAGRVCVLLPCLVGDRRVALHDSVSCCMCGVPVVEALWASASLRHVRRERAGSALWWWRLAMSRPDSTWSAPWPVFPLFLGTDFDRS
eukprot:3475095-Rhodomonas_salina.2